MSHPDSPPPIRSELTGVTLAGKNFSHPTDAFLFRWLDAMVPLDDTLAEALANWWKTEAQPEERLADFLVRQGFFVADAPQIIEAFRLGQIASCDRKRLFGADGLFRFQKYLRALLQGHPTRTANDTATHSTANVPTPRPTSSSMASSAKSGTRPPISNPNHSPSDTFLLGFLEERFPLDRESLALLEAWWQRERNPNEELAAFLVRNDIFVVDAPSQVQAARVGSVVLEQRNLFTMPGRIRLQQRIRQDKENAAKLLGGPKSISASLSSIIRRKSPDETDFSQLLEQLRPGMSVGRCILKEFIGEGAVGRVYRAIHKTLDIPVAVKVMKFPPSAASKEYEQFRREAQLLAKVTHENVVRVWDFDDDPALPYLVLEYIEGMTLQKLLQQTGALSLAQAINNIAQVARGLEAAQRIGVVHRDVKPGNILISRDGVLKIIDLGVAVIIRGKSFIPEKVNPENLVGTAAYMSPEQASCTPMDYRSDIYSLGVTFYELVTGQLPFTGKSHMELFMKHIKQMPKPPHEVTPTLPPIISEVILRMMAKDPNHRYQTYAELLADLNYLQQNLVPQG